MNASIRLAVRGREENQRLLQALEQFLVIGAPVKLALPFLAGYLLDLLLGDPPHWPHPVRLIGRAIANTGKPSSTSPGWWRGPSSGWR